MNPRISLAIALLILADGRAMAQDVAPGGAGERDPVLRLEGGGPLSPVSAVAFGPGGGVLYEAGWDKVVRVWRREAGTGRCTPDRAAPLRGPMRPGAGGG